jgi:UDP-N-acetyl-D-glucosamine dehydrogenase
MNHLTNLSGKIKNHQAVIGIIGLGYVGLPLVLRFQEEKFPVIGFDIDPAKVKMLSRGQSYIKHIPAKRIEGLAKSGLFEATTDYSRLKEADAVIICVPTPLSKNKEPDMSYIEVTSDEIAKALRPGQLVSLESTTYPGTTREILLPKFERRGLKAGRDFFLIFSPEREDPGNPNFHTQNIPKVVGGVTPACKTLGSLLYFQIVDRVITVSSTEVAEFTKILENTFRAVNIALVNELKILADRMNVDIRSSRVQTVRFYALLSGTRPRRALYSHRPLLSRLESQRAQLQHPFHRAGRGNQHQYAVLCRDENR